MTQIEQKPDESAEKNGFQYWVLEFFKKRAEKAQKEYEIVKEKTENFKGYS